ncbi:flavin monoamine oxidase family protein [Sphingobacterium prati]|uniref:flavin monoamine oxidase family protein n=1 Tax=Sphingobacterium prati TaxID=2737006 RepID=UPI00155469A5|nr:NAD(P)/FAD-dependent oxidoreductase [Sphingobacterium prati]NPE46208.1 NAD(P)-binding protein [Sphingobacterium prati]
MMTKNNEERVAVIGAGIAGLYMVKLLLAKGYDVSLFEASARIGGRIKGYQFDDITVDLGGEWLHQFNDNPNSLTSIIEDAGQAYRSISNYNDHQNNNEETKADPKQVESFINYIQNTPFKLDVQLSETIRNFSGDPGLKTYFDTALVDMASSTENFSTKEFIHLLPALEPSDYELKDTSMSSFIHNYFSDIPKQRIHLSTPIKVICYDQESVALTTEEGKKLNFARAIVAVPISQLKNNSIKFVPQLSHEKRLAIQKIGMGTGLKAFFFFEEKILKKSAFAQQYAPYYIEKKIGKYVVVITIIMGHYAKKYYENPVTYQEGMLDELATLAGRNLRPLLKSTKFQDWTKEPFIEGTYSFPMLGEGNAREVASSPIKNRIFFIGEAMNTNYAYGFIHGALETAEKVNEFF